MVIFREHRGGLSESLETAREFENFDDMKKYIYQIHKDFCQKIGVANAPFEMSDIVIDHTSKTEDTRTNWHDTMYVCVKRYGDEDYIEKYGTPQCIGMLCYRLQKINNGFSNHQLIFSWWFFIL